MKRTKKYDISLANSSANQNQISNLKDLFQKELDQLADTTVPETRSLKQWNESPIVKDPEAARLLNGNQPMMAMFMAMFAQEQYPHFKEVVDAHFKDFNCEVQCSYTNDAVQIWQKITDYEGCLIGMANALMNAMYFALTWFKVPV